MNKLCRFALLLTLLACLLLPAGASAVTSAEIAALRGERSYPQALDLPDALSVAAQSNGVMLRAAGNGYPQPDRDKISALADRYIDEIRDIGDAVDFLSVFTTDYVGALVHQANHIQSMYLQCESQLKKDNPAGAEQIAQTIEDYSLSASRLYSEVEFLTTKLTYCYNRMDVLVGFIQSGLYTPSETDEWLAELDELVQEAETRLNDFTNETNLEKLLTDYFTAQLMLTAMETVIDQLHQGTKEAVSAGAAELDAAENGSGKLRRADTHVTIVSKSEYVVTVAGPNGSPLKRAEVEIRVLDGDGKLVRKLQPKKTNEHGYAIFCFSDMNPDSKGKASVEIWVRAEGYRTQATGRVTVEGGGFTPVRLEKDDGSPYIVQVTYNGDDILRTSNGIYISPFFVENQTISITVNTKYRCTVSMEQFAGEDGDHTVLEFDVELGQPGDAVQNSEHPTEYTCTITRAFCSDKYFLRKADVKMYIRWAPEGQDKNQLKGIATPFVIRKARVANPINRNGSNMFMGTVGITLPSDFPFVGGGRLQLPIASEKFINTFFIDVNGTIYIGHQWEDKGFPLKSDAQKKRDAFAAELKKEGANAISQMFRGIANDYRTLNEAHVIGNLSGSCVPYLLAILRCGEIDDDEEIDDGWYEFQADADFGLILAFKASFTWQPFPWVPVLVGADFSMGINMGFDFGFKLDVKGDLSAKRNFRLSDSFSLMTVSPFLDVSIFVGFGVPRGAYVGVRGRAYVTADFIFGPLPILCPGYTFAKAYANVTIEAAILWYKKSWVWAQTSWSDAWEPGAQSAVLLASLEEATSSYAASTNGGFPLDPDAPVGGEAYRTRTGQITPTSIIRMCETENTNVRFLPISMAFSRKQGNDVSDMGLAMWIENKAISGVQRYRLCYRATSLDDVNDLAGLSAQTFVLDFGLGNDYDIADFDVDYYCKDDTTAPELSVLITAVPRGTPEAQVEQETQLYFAQFTAEYGTAVNRTGDVTKEYPTVIFNRKDNSARRITSIDRKTEKGFIMPRVKVLAGKNEVVLGALHPYAYGSVRYSVMMSDVLATYELTSYQEISDPDMEPIEFQLLDRKLIGRGIIENSPACFLLLHSKSQESKSRFCMISSSGQGGGSGYSMASIGGGSINLSSFRMIEGYDVRYNRRQVGIGALRTVRDEDTGLYQSRLFLMRLEWGGSLSFERFWDSLSPVDTGVTLGAGGFAFMEINGVHYAYWVTSTVNKQGDTVFDVNACYINIDKQMASKPFSMLSVVDPKRDSYKNENDLAGVTLLPLVSGSNSLHGMFLSGVYTESTLSSRVDYRWGKFAYAIQIGMEVKTLVPDYPVILPGDTFTSTLRLCNTGMLPIYNFDIDFFATPEGESTNFVTQLHVDMLNLKNNAMRNAAKQPIKSGESSVYRVDDGTKKSNGETVRLTRYSTNIGFHSDDGQISKWKEETKTLRVLPADGELTIRASFTAPRNCWGSKSDATLTAMVHGLEAGLDLEKTDDTATFAGGRGVENLDDGAVRLTSAQPVALTAANGNDTFEKVTLNAACVSYAYLDGRGQRTDESDLDLTGNDMTLKADVVLLGGEPTARIILSNLDGAQAEDVTPMLVAMVDGKETWRHALQTELTSDYTRCLTLPLATLAGGKPYRSIDLYLTSTGLDDVLDFDDFNEIDDYDNHVTLCPVYDFHFITEPQSTTVFVGQDIELTAEAAGTSGPFTYQWVEVNTDGTLRALRGETGTTLTLKNVTLAQNNTKYRCIATNSQGIQRLSNTATLTVSEELPVTGDSSHAAAWLALLGASCLLLCLAKRRAAV